MTTDVMYQKIETILNRVEGEFARFPFRDKYRYYQTIFEYKFENGDVVKFLFTGRYTVEICNNSVNDFWTIKSNGKDLYDIVALILSRIVNGSMGRVGNTPRFKVTITK